MKRNTVRKLADPTIMFVGTCRIEWHTHLATEPNIRGSAALWTRVLVFGYRSIWMINELISKEECSLARAAEKQREQQHNNSNNKNALIRGYSNFVLISRVIILFVRPQCRLDVMHSTL